MKHSQMNGFSRTFASSAPFNGLLQAVALIVLLTSGALGQGGGSNTLYGDLKVDESKVSGLKPMSFDVVLTGRNRSAIGHQTVAKNGRFRFENLANGTYYISVRMDSTEIANVRVTLLGGSSTDNRISSDYRQDIALEWRPNPSAREEKGSVISALKHYQRTPPNESLFDKAEKSIKDKEYARAITMLRQVVSNDQKDFEAWTELGTAYFLTKNSDESEKSYLQALGLEPNFILALLDLGKLRLEQKKFEGAVEVLSKAAALPPASAEVNYFLGEAYLNLKKGSKAVAYMNEALKIDPQGKAEIHLRIADIYDAVGLKNLAAVEYEKFLQKRSDYPEKKKLQRYIAQNKNSKPPTP
ncbi:MAG: tetratricopeptide repeat protein [Blastocatellia bacterium]|nr:tetratricopeptide repeat protein [Blastocatellia bacterium]